MLMVIVIGVVVLYIFYIAQVEVQHGLNRQRSNSLITSTNCSFNGLARLRLGVSSLAAASLSRGKTLTGLGVSTVN